MTHELDQQAVLAQVDGEDEISAKLLEASGAMAKDKRAVATPSSFSSSPAWSVVPQG
jgi:hypothetical protein